MITDLTNKLNKATYIIKRASDGDASILEDDGDEIDPKIKTVSVGLGGHVDVDQNVIANSDGFSKKKGFKINKSDKEVEEYLKSVSGTKSSKIMFTKFTQTANDPLRMLIDSKSRLVEMTYPQELVKRGIDILLRLIGYKSIEDMMADARSNSVGKKG